MSFILLALISAVIAQFVGWLWYMPIFGKKWMWVVADHTAHGKMQEMDYPIINFIIAFVFFFLLGVLGVPDFRAVAMVAGIVLVGFIFPVNASGILWNGKTAKKQLTMFGISFGFHILHVAIMCLVFNWLA